MNALPLLALLWLAHPRAVPHVPDPTVLWIGAHPDDESLVAPLLGRSCVEGRAACSMIVFTASPAVRRDEMASAANALHSRLTQLDFPDVLQHVRDAWTAYDPGVVQHLRELIAQERPTLILTFDPAHGSTCHEAHRTVGNLVLEACSEGGCPPIYFVETSVTFDGDDIRFDSAVTEPEVFDASRYWHYLTDDMAIHASQFNAAQIASVAATPAKVVRLLPAAAAPNATYLRACP